MASVIKSLLRFFRKYGAEVYLMTGFDLLKVLRNNKKKEIKFIKLKFLINSKFLIKRKNIANFFKIVRL